MSMKLELDEEEVKRILLDWADKRFGPVNFNTVTIESGYSSFKNAVLTREEKKEDNINEIV